MSSAEAEYIDASTACMAAAHIRSMVYNFINFGTSSHSTKALEQSPPALIILDNTAAIATENTEKTSPKT